MNSWPLTTPPVGVPFELNRQSSLAYGLAAWWPMLGSRGANIIRDYSGRGVNGTILPANVTWQGDANAGYGLTLDTSTTNNRTDFGDIEIAGDITVMCWARMLLRSNERNTAMVGKWDVGSAGVTNEWILSANYFSSGTDYYPYFQISIGATGYNVAQTTTWALNEWVFLCGVRRGTTIEIYRSNNGRLLSNSAACGAGSINTGTARRIRLGQVDGYLNANTSATYGDVGIWERALSAAEVGRLFAPQTRYEMYAPIPRFWPVGIAAAGGGGATYEMAATLTAISDTNTPAMQVVRPLSATATGISDTTTASLQVVRPSVATLTAASNTSDISLQVIRALASTLTAQSNTSDITLNIVRQLSATLTGISDTTVAALYVLRPSSAILTAISSTSDIELITAGLYEMAATLTAISNTNEASLRVARSSSAILTAVSSTNEIALLVSGILEMAATLTAVSNTSESALSVLRASLATLTAISNTSNADLLKYLNSVATLTVASDTSTAALQVIRQAAATLTAPSATNEVALQVIRRLSATLTAQSNTSDATLVTSIIVGLVTASFSARQPGAGFTVSQPSADFDT